MILFACHISSHSSGFVDVIAIYFKLEVCYNQVDWTRQRCEQSRKFKHSLTLVTSVFISETCYA
jgi:hypothetical protein